MCTQEFFLNVGEDICPSVTRTIITIEWIEQVAGPPLQANFMIEAVLSNENFKDDPSEESFSNF